MMTSFMPDTCPEGRQPTARRSDVAGPGADGDSGVDRAYVSGLWQRLMTPAAMQGPACIDLPQHAASVAQARAFVRKVCLEAGLPFEMCDTAVLLTSETVTNSFRHARGGARLAVTADGDGLLVEVGDDDPQPPYRRAADHESLSGRGMAIVELLASRWGTYATPAGKVVWFRVGVA